MTNEIIRKALHPYPDDLVIVTKVGCFRGDDASWNPALSKEDLTKAVHDNLGRLKVDALDVVNLRVGGLLGPIDGSIAGPFAVLADLQKQGLIKHLGLSNVNSAQLAEAQTIGDVVCVQNFYNLANRGDDAFIEELAEKGIAYVPFFPLGGFSPIQSSILDSVGADVGATSMQVAQAWLLRRSPNILLIPGTSSVKHLLENLEAASLSLPSLALTELNAIGA